MKILGSSVSLTQLDAPLFSTVMAIDYAINAANMALSAAHCDPVDLDMIVTFSISPSHLSHSPEIIGPRLGHPLQQLLHAKNAIVLDLLDCDWTFALDVVKGFLNEMKFEKALIVRAECFTGLRIEKQCELNMQEGAGALIVTASASNNGTPEYHDLVDQSSPAWIAPLSSKEMVSSQKYANLYFTGSTTLATKYSLIKHDLLERAAIRNKKIDYVIGENWFSAPNSAQKNSVPPHQKEFHIEDETGPFAIPKLLSSISQGIDKPTKVFLTSFDPFKLRLGCCMVEL